MTHLRSLDALAHLLPRTARVAVLVPCLLLARAALAVEVPPLEGRVNDRAALLAPDARARLERKLADYEASSGHQFALLTMPALDGEAIEGFSMRVVQAWKLGRADVNDGLLMLVVKDPHGIRIEVGSGLEDAIPDSLAAQSIRDMLAPAFRRGDFADGIDGGFDMLMTAGSGGTVAPPAPAPRQPDESTRWLLLLLLTGLPFGALTVLFIAQARGEAPRTSGSGATSGADFINGGSPGAGGGASGGGGFSGGGGSFGGGGASGSW